MSTDTADRFHSAAIHALRHVRREDTATGVAPARLSALSVLVFGGARTLGEPCYVCGTPIARVDFEEHTIYYCPECQTGGRVLKDRRLSRLLR